MQGAANRLPGSMRHPPCARASKGPPARETLLGRRLFSRRGLTMAKRARKIYEDTADVAKEKVADATGAVKDRAIAASGVAKGKAVEATEAIKDKAVDVLDLSLI